MGAQNMTTILDVKINMIAGEGGGLYDRDIHMSSENYEGRGHGLDLDEHGFCVLGEVG